MYWVDHKGIQLSFAEYLINVPLKTSTKLMTILHPCASRINMHPCAIDLSILHPCAR